MRINSPFFITIKRPRAWEGSRPYLLLRECFTVIFQSIFGDVINYEKFYLSNNDKSMLFTIAYMLEIIICNDN